MSAQAWAFAGFTFSAARGLERDGESFDLQPKVRTLLELLLRARGAVVPKEAIAAALWPGETASDDSHARIAHLLRKTLERGGAGEILKTIYGAGLRLICEVSDVGDEPGRTPPVREVNAALSALMRTAYEVASGHTAESLGRGLETLRYASDQYPDYAPTWSMKADVIAALALRCAEEASAAAEQIAEFTARALTLDPRNANALATSAFSLALLCDRPNEGRERMEAAARLEPKCLPVLYYRAWLRVATRDLEGALEDVQTALAQSPLERGLLSLRAWLIACLGRYQDAEAIAAKDVKLRPDIDTLYYARTVAADAMGDFDSALVHARRAVEISPRDSMTLSFLSYAQARVGDVSAARRNFEMARGTTGARAPAFLVAPLLALGDLEGARDMLRLSAEQLSPWRVFSWCDPRLASLA